MRTATTSYQNTTGRNVYTCDRHATVDDAKGVGGPYRTWEVGALVGASRVIDPIRCQVCHGDRQGALPTWLDSHRY